MKTETSISGFSQFSFLQWITPKGNPSSTQSSESIILTHYRKTQLKPRVQAGQPVARIIYVSSSKRAIESFRVRKITCGACAFFVLSVEKRPVANPALIISLCRVHQSLHANNSVEVTTPSSPAISTSA